MKRECELVSTNLKNRIWGTLFLLSEEQKIVMWWRSVDSIFALIIKVKLTSTPVLVILNSDSVFELYITQEGCTVGFDGEKLNEIK